MADPDLQVISDGLRKGLAEPWRVVELAACAGVKTPFAIPERIISVEYTVGKSTCTITRITKVIITKVCYAASYCCYCNHIHFLFEDQMFVPGH